MRTKLTMLFFTIAVAGLLGPDPAAQIIVLENHYKVYEVPEAFPVVMPIILTDQFGSFPIDSVTLDKFATPVVKNGSQMVDPAIHQTWWEFFQPQDSAPGR